MESNQAAGAQNAGSRPGQQLSTKGLEILRAVLAAMPGARESGGPQGADYIALMAAVASEAQQRAASHNEALCGAFVLPGGWGWSYQAPRHEDVDSRQRYYRADRWQAMGLVDCCVDGPRLKLFRWATGQAARLTLELPNVGELGAELDANALRLLRDACNDALQDIAQAEVDRLRRESLDEIREELGQAAAMGRDGTGVYYSHPDVHYVATAEEAEAKLGSIDMGIVMVAPELAGAAAA